MVAAVGLTARSACAAIRAGITRTSPLPMKEVLFETLEEVPLQGHSLGPLTTGFVGFARIARIASAAVSDLFEQAALDPEDPVYWADTRLVICTARPRSDDEGLLDDMLEGQLRTRLPGLCGLPLPALNAITLMSGHSAALEAIRHVQEALDSGASRRVILLAVDSLVTEDALLELVGRLKCADNPVGLMPGEAGVALLIESEGSVSSRGDSACGFIKRVSYDVEEGARESDEPGPFFALARAVNGALAEREKVGCVIGDLNGESLRAVEWGTALNQLCATHPSIAEVQLQLPAISTGDTGAASGAVAMAFAAHSFARMKPAHGTALVFSSADTGEVAAALLEAS